MSVLLSFSISLLSFTKYEDKALGFQKKLKVQIGLIHCADSMLNSMIVLYER